MAEVRVLGPFQATGPTGSTALTSSRQRALVGLLAMTPGTPVSVSRLVTGIWGEDAPRTAVRTLQSHVVRAKQTLADCGLSDLLTADRSGYTLNVNPHDVDAYCFEDRVRAARQLNAAGDLAGAAAGLEAALELWCGEPLQGTDLSGWGAAEVTRLQEARLTAIENRCDALLRLGMHAQAEEELQRLCGAYPERERPAGLLMLARYRSGRHAEALSSYAELRARLAETLGVDPSPELQRLHTAMLCRDPALDAVEPARSTAAVAAVRAVAPAPAPSTQPSPPARVPGNLPNPLTRLIGREQQVAAVRDMLLSPDARLVTLVGAPGIGKSRLATQVAATLREAFPDGVWYVALGLVSDAGLVVPTVVKTLGLKETAGVESLETLVSHLRDRRVLLLLDNLEHVLDSAPLIAATLTGCTGAKVLATSRSRLRIRGERLYPVPPLRALAVNGEVSAATAARYPAVQLFVERAQEAQPDFELTDATATDICRICADLDGLPLAIELVAARTRALAPAELVARLGDRLGLLTDGPRDSPAHHRTLRSTIGWSYEVLSAAEQRLFARLSVFAGGFPVCAAEEVAGSDELGTSVLDGLIGLADKNLLHLEERADGQRYGAMLATIREYGLERLAAGGEEEAVRRRHADYYLHLAETCRPHLGGPQQRLWLDRLDADQHNVRAALSWHVQCGDVQHAALMVVGIWYFWHIRFRQTEGLHWIEQVLARPDEQDPRVRAQVLYGAGWLAVDHCDHELARRYFAESLAQYRSLDDVRGVAEVLHGVGTIAQTSGDSAQAVQVFSESLACYRQVGDEEGTGWSLDHLGNAALDLGDYTRADELFAEGLSIFRRLRHSWGAALALHHLGLTALALGRHAAARQRFTEARQIFTELANTWGVAISCDHLGHVALATRQYAAAREHFVESLMSSHAEDDRHGVARSLAGLASVAVADGDLVQAARLFGSAEALADSSGIWMNPITRARHDRDTATVRSGLDHAPVARAWAAGKAMTPAEMVAAAV